MPKYLVEVKELLFHSVELEADNESKAYELGMDIISDLDPSNYTTISDGLFDTDVKEIN